MNIYQIIKGAIITEKTTTLRSLYNVYVFNVDTKANKYQIKEAVEKIFNVKVESVNTEIVKPKIKRLGRTVGKTNKIKKAYVKVKDGYVINQFEGI